MTSSITLWLKFAGIALAQRMAYRAEYLMSLIAMFFIELISPLFAYVIYYNSSGFVGWTLYQVILLQGIFIFVKGVCSVTFYGIVWNSNHLVSAGTFDLILLKPKNALFLFICKSVDIEDLGKVACGILLSGYAIYHLENLSYLSILIAIVSILIGIAFFFCLALLSSAFIFKIIQSFRVYEVFDLFALLGQYPKSIYPKVVGVIFTYILPILLVAAVPAEKILGISNTNIFISGFVTLILVIICMKIWFVTINNYSSGGG